MSVEWWHWMIGGILLVLLEFAVPAFFVIWFGLGALVVGLVLIGAPAVPLAGQISIWIAASIAFIVLWVKIFRAHVHRTRAKVTKAEGEKQAMILAADGRLESAKRDAVAQVTLAEASARAIQKVAEAMGQQEAPLYYLLGEKYIHSMTELAGSQNSKIVLLPADLQDSLRGLLGRK